MLQHDNHEHCSVNSVNVECLVNGNNVNESGKENMEVTQNLEMDRVTPMLYREGLLEWSVPNVKIDNEDFCNSEEVDHWAHAIMLNDESLEQGVACVIAHDTNNNNSKECVMPEWCWDIVKMYESVMKQGYPNAWGARIPLQQRPGGPRMA